MRRQTAVLSCLEAMRLQGTGVQQCYTASKQCDFKVQGYSSVILPGSNATSRYSSVILLGSSATSMYSSVILLGSNATSRYRGPTKQYSAWKNKA